MIMRGNKYFSKRRKGGSLQTGGKDKHSYEKRPQTFATQYHDMEIDKNMPTKWPPRHILVVDDEGMMRALNCKMLIDAGYSVEGADDGAAAWDTLQLKSFDLLITDNSMPRMTGIELIGKVRGAGLALPIIMATAVLPEGAFTRSPRLQPAVTLIKPYTQVEFLDAVKNVLDGAVPTVSLQSRENGNIISATVQRFAEKNRNIPPVFTAPHVNDFIQLDELHAVTEAAVPERLLSKT
jgi:CheY-like chemotaxis protein